MFKSLFTVMLLFVFLLSLSVFAGNSNPKTIVHNQMPKIEEPISTKPMSSNSSYTVGDKVGTAVLAGTMWNAYSTQSPFTNLIYFEPYSGAMAIVHRGNNVQAPGSGYAFYTASFDGGVNWTDGIGPFSFSGNTTMRHPNLVISNPTQGTDPFTATSVLMFWNSLVPLAWETIQTTTDPFFAASATDTAQWLNTPEAHFVNAMGVKDTDGSVWVPVVNQAVQEYYLFWTLDQGANWDSTIISPRAWHGPGGNFGSVEWAPDGLNGVFGWEGQSAARPHEYHFGYVKTTDGGLTWDSSPTWIPSPTIVDLPAPCLNNLNYETDMIVDVNGDPHFICTYVDSVDGSNTGNYEIYWNGTNWAANLITLVNRTNFALPGGLSTLNEVELARSMDGTKLYAKYIDLPDTTIADSLDDVFITSRNLGDASWSTPENVTQTPLIHEKYSNLAPRVIDKMHIYYTIFGDGDTNDLAESEIWYLQDVFTGIDEEIEGNLTTDFRLSQNHPNPFNPSTNIAFNISKATNVTLEVYNVLGKKVATLVNGKVQAGEKIVTFDGTNHASGVYFYKLTAGDLIQTKKMLLVK